VRIPMTPEIVLTLAALGGITMVFIRLGGAPRPPTWMALGHGLIAIVGVAILASAAMRTGVPQMEQIALWLFALAALGGTAIFAMFHLPGKALPIPLILGHGLIALVALTLLLLY
jgi:hypothetical protein